MILPIVIMIAGLLFGANAPAATLCPTIGPGVEWDGTCFKADHHGRRVKQSYIKRLRPRRNGYTIVMISEPRELVAVDRRGRVVVPGIMQTGDFDFPHAYHGIGRFETKSSVGGGKAQSKCGYFDSHSFRIVVPAEYDECERFADGKAVACKQCSSLCTEPECQNSVLVGGEGVILGLDGKVRDRFKQSDTKPGCIQASSNEHGAAGQAATTPPCAPQAVSPFDQLK